MSELEAFSFLLLFIRWLVRVLTATASVQFTTVRVHQARQQLGAQNEGSFQDVQDGFGQDPDETIVPLARHLLEFRLSTTNEPMSEKDLISELMGHLSVFCSSLF